MYIPNNNLERLEEAKSSSEKLLNLLKMRGPLSSADLGKILGITGEAVRQQMAKLSDEGLILAYYERRGVGRPRQMWKLTEAGESCFSDRHALVTIQLIEQIRSHFGQRALDQIIHNRSEEISQNYVEALQSKGTLKQKIAALAKLRTSEGYMAEWREEPDGSFLLIENHCPICAAASRCQSFCVTERETLEEALGRNRVTVERKEHILSGSRRCLYRIIPRSTRSHSRRNSKSRSSSASNKQV